MKFSRFDVFFTFLNCHNFFVRYGYGYSEDSSDDMEKTVDHDIKVTSARVEEKITKSRSQNIKIDLQTLKSPFKNKKFRFKFCLSN